MFVSSEENLLLVEEDRRSSAAWSYRAQQIEAGEPALGFRPRLWMGGRYATQEPGCSHLLRE